MASLGAFRSTLRALGLSLCSCSRLCSCSLHECDGIEWQGKLWLVPHWLDSTATGETTPTRIIRFDHLPHSDVWGTNLGEKLKGMHWRTYECLCRIHGAAQAR